MDNVFQSVNRNIPRTEGYRKASGRALYGADLFRPAMLCLKPVICGVPSGIVRSVDVSGAEKLPLVAGIFGRDDLPGEKCFGILCPDQPVFTGPGDRVRYAGDVVCVAAAETEEAAERAAEAVRVVIDPLPAVTPALSDLESAIKAPEIMPGIAPGNVVSVSRLKRGDPERAAEGAAAAVDGEYETQRIEHCYIEPEAVLTEKDGRGRLIVRGSIQLPFYLLNCVRSCLALPEDGISIQRSEVGGSFGGKVEEVQAMAIRAGLVTLKTGRPAKYVLTREESFLQSHKRHPWRMRLRLSADANGLLTAASGKALTDSGPYMQMTPAVAWKGNVSGLGCYRIPRVSYETTAVVTNNINSSSMRGFGTPQTLFAVESAMNELAAALGISPLEIRRRNLLADGDISPAGDRLTRHKVSLGEALSRVAEESGFEEKWERYRKPQKGRFRKGIGIALSMRGVSSGAEANDVSRALIRITEDGSAELVNGLAEIGQGLGTVIRQFCAEALGIPVGRVRLNSPDTSIEPDTGGAVGSRATMMGGNCVLRAVEDLKRQMSAALTGILSLPAGSEAVLSDDHVMIGDKVMTFPEAARLILSGGHELLGRGEYAVPKMSWDPDTEQGQAFVSYTYSCQASEVELDTWTGRVRVLKMTCCHDVGRAVNPDMVEGQIHGGAMMSLGYALTEEFRVRGGLPETADLTTYLIPTSEDVPEIRAIILENPDPDCPYGAKSIGEAALELGISSIGAAVNQAMGTAVPLRRVPMTPERVLMHMKEEI